MTYISRRNFLKLSGAGIAAFCLAPGTALAADQTDYHRAFWRRAHPNNYVDANRGPKKIDRVVIHVAEGSFAGTINWFKHYRAGVSGHYVVARDGRVAQCVREVDIARHVGRWSADERSISIEHAGYRSKRWTDDQYRASARLTASICRRNKIPVDSQHIVKHKHIYSGTTCPGRHFDLDRYVELVKRYRRSM